jgi:hypothetical protein
MSRIGEAHEGATEREVGRPLPACYECGTQRPLLWSFAPKGEYVGRALCELCLAKAMKESGEV